MSKKISFSPLRRKVSLLLFLLLPEVLTISGCSKELQGAYSHIKGYLAWKRSDWSDAVLYFYEAEETAETLQHKKLLCYTNFALASTYLMQGEDGAATEKIQHILETDSDIFPSYCFYQQGIIAFRSNNYADAAALFKKSLELSGDDMDTKINYELSKRLAERQQEIQSKNAQQPLESPEAELTDSIILNIVRKREHSKWTHLQHEVEPAVNDY